MKWILLILLAGFGGSIYYNKHLEKELSDEEKRIKLEDSRLSQLETEVQSKKALVLQEINQEQQAITRLKAQLEAKQTERNTLADKLNVAKNFNDGDRRLSTIKWDLQHKKENISNLENQLKALSAQRTSLEGQGKYSDQQQKQTYQNQDLAYGQNILAEQQKLKAMTDQYNYLRKQRSNYTAVEQAQQMPAQIDNEKLYIQKLQLDRQAYRTNWEANKNANSQGNSLSIGDLKNQEATLKAQLQQEKNEYQALDQQQHSQSGSASSEKNDINSLQRQISDADSVIKGLQDQIKEHEARITQLNSNHS